MAKELDMQGVEVPKEKYMQASSGLYVPNSYIKLTEPQRHELKHDEATREAYIKRELYLLSRPGPEGFIYYLENYGAAKPPKSNWIPLNLWDFQYELAEAIASLSDMMIIVLKARRLGFTLLMLHYFVWYACFSAEGPGGYNLALNKDSDSATKFVYKTRQLISLMPSYIRPRIGQAEVDTNGEKEKTLNRMRMYEVVGRAHSTIEALPAKNTAARGDTADNLFYDEEAHPDGAINHEVIMASIEETTEGGGKIIRGSTGNGMTGRGAGFAKAWLNASAGKNSYKALYYGWQAHPDRDQEWYDTKLANKNHNLLLMQQEYPDQADPMQALRGDTGDMYFNVTHLSACVKLGKEIQAAYEAGELPRPPGNKLTLSGDYGQVASFTLSYPLPRCGMHVLEEWVDDAADAPEFCKRVLQNIQTKYLSKGYDLGTVYYDSNGIYSHRSFITASNDRWPSMGTVLSQSIDGKPLKDWLSEFIRDMQSRTYHAMEKDYSWHDMTGYYSINPDCEELYRQMQGAKKKNGKIYKNSAKGHSDDHSMDAEIAGALGWMNEYQAKYGSTQI